MITVKFYVRKEIFEFTAESVGKAMEMCNRQVIDKLQLHPMVWADTRRPNEFVCHPGNFFD